MRTNVDIEIGDRIEFHYKNWKGAEADRRVSVSAFRYGSTEFHQEPQWLMTACDLDKNAERDFAMRDMSKVKRLKD